MILVTCKGTEILGLGGIKFLLL